MLVSVIIPTFNRASLLKRAIDSVLKQSYGNIEIIIVDDGSTDDTQFVVADISKQTNQIKYIKKGNGGCASARNYGLKYATGTLISFLDSDDALESDAIYTLASALTEAKSEFVYSPSIEVHEDGSEVICRPASPFCPEMFAFEHFKTTNARPAAILYKRDVFSKVNGFDESLRFNEDSDFLQRVAICCRGFYIDIPTVRVYHHQDNKSKNRVGIYKALLKSSQNILEEYPNFAAKLGADADIRIRQIKTQLVEALATNSEFTDANSIGRDILSSLRLNVRIAIFCKSNIPLKLETISRRTAHNLVARIRQSRIFIQYLGIKKSRQRL